MTVLISRILVVKSKSACLAGVSFLLLSLGSVALSQRSELDNVHPSGCDRYDSVQPPAADLPTVQDRKSLQSCNSADLYFGFDHPADHAKARKCAYIERENGKGAPETVFGGAGLLTMIYANGKGASRNFDIALKFACEVDGAPAENYYRFEHILTLQKEHWNSDNFSLCDDATSGFMQGACAGLQENFDRVARDRKLNKITASWSPRESGAFRELRQAAEAFFEARSRNEVDLTGTGRAAFEIEAKASLEDDFVAALEKFELGQLPTFSAGEFSEADAKLNLIYSKTQSAEPDGKEILGAVTPHGIKIAERAWLRYREAWVDFGRLKYPSVSPESWRTWLTQERIHMLDGWPK